TLGTIPSPRVPHGGRGIVCGLLFASAHGEFFRESWLRKGPTDGATSREMMIFCTIESKPLALPWGQTPRLDSGVRKSRHLHFPVEERYLTPLWVSRKADELYDPSQDAGFELSFGKIIHDKIKIILKMLPFREQQVLVQFWSPRVVGKHRLHTTIDQPFGLGVINDEGLYSYRRDSESKCYVADKDHDEEDLSPPARVFRLGLPEWTSNVTNYLPKDFPQQECAICCNLNGYLALPVFNLTTGSRVGVIELLTSSIHPSFAYEVQQFQRALKTQNLTCRQVSDAPVSDVINEKAGAISWKIFSVF
ncbi:hypothetical protein Tco_0986535, partial [Tanacetum coccineum]